MRSKSKSPDVADLIPVLLKLVNLCRKLDLPKEAAVYARIARRFQKTSPPWERATIQVGTALSRCVTIGPIFMRLGRDLRPFYRIRQEYYDFAFPRQLSKKAPERRRNWKAIRKSKTFWELTGESELHAVTIPDPPRAGGRTTVRLTLSNPYGPLDNVELFVRVTDEDDADSASDWVQARLIEEIVYVDDEEMLRSKVKNASKGETPWDATYEAKLVIPKGVRSIEIKIVSKNAELRSMVLRDWTI